MLIADLGYRPRNPFFSGSERLDEPGYLAHAATWLAKKQILDVEGDWIDKRLDCGRAVGPLNTRTTTIPTLMTRRWWPWLWTAWTERSLLKTRPRSRMGCRDAKQERRMGPFDADNTYDYLNHILFADHGALLDPPTADVTARCVGMFAQLDAEKYAEPIRKGVAFLKSEQEEDGSCSPQGTNYVYGTWSVLCP